MESLYTNKGFEQMRQRIHRLLPDTPQHWGKMNVAQMFAHVQVPLEVALGRHDLPKSFFMKLFGPMMGKRLLSDKPTPKNQPTASTMRMTTPKNFAEEKIKLLNILHEFTERGKANQLPERHPYFGKFTADDWSRFQVKHLDHHLRQFGV